MIMKGYTFVVSQDGLFDTAYYFFIENTCGQHQFIGFRIYNYKYWNIILTFILLEFLNTRNNVSAWIITITHAIHALPTQWTNYCK